MGKRIQSVLMVVCMVVFGGQLAYAGGKLPNVKIPASGGTIAGAGVTGTTTVAYTAGPADLFASIN